MGQQIVTVVGGTGFLGRYVVRQLAAAGYTIRVIARNPEAAGYLKTAGQVGQIILAKGDITNPETLEGKLDYSAAVINLAGILYESGRQKFTAVHAQGAEELAEMAKTSGVRRFIHISALGVDKAKGSKYARSKLLGEKAVMEAFPEATILRPSIIFGAEDNFFNLFAGMAGIAPALPLIGGGKTKFQPVYVGDIAKAVLACLMHADAPGCTYELGGPRVYTFKEILEYILETIGKQRPLVPLPFSLASFKAMFAQYLPPPFKFTPDQVKLLQYDNVVSPDAVTFADLGIQPTAVEMIVPEYLSRFSKKVAA